MLSPLDYPTPDVVHNLFSPLLPKDSNITLKVLPFDVLNARAYPSEAQLAKIDAIVISGSFEDDAHEDAIWILRLAGFLIGISDSYVYAPSPLVIQRGLRGDQWT